MNILLMVVMMGLGMILFHGMGHHQSTSASEHPKDKTSGVTAPPPETSGAGLRHEHRQDPVPVPKAIEKGEAISPELNAD